MLLVFSAGTFMNVKIFLTLGTAHLLRGLLSYAQSPEQIEIVVLLWHNFCCRDKFVPMGKAFDVNRMVHIIVTGKG